jgi:hypothetical protein
MNNLIADEPLASPPAWAPATAPIQETAVEDLR